MRSRSRRRCARIDVLVIDDLQFLQGKSTQAEFCHTLNALIDAGRQVVIAADRPPSDLESLDERVRSRLAGGLVVEMGSLGEELRLRNPQMPRRCRQRERHPGFRRSTAGSRVHRQDRDPQRARPRGRAQPAARAHSELTGQPRHARNGRARGARPDPPQEPKRVKIEDIQTRGRPSVQCEPCRPLVVPAHRECSASATGGDVPRQDARLCARFPRSDGDSAAVTTPPCCMRCARSKTWLIPIRRCAEEIEISQAQLQE